MDTNYASVVAGMLLYLSAALPASSQIQFLDCPSVPVSLCLDDPDVSLPNSNQFFLGENHPDATSCSVHVFHTTKVKVLCGDYVTYDISILLAGDTSEIYLTTLGSAIDSNQEATLFLNTGNVANNEITWNGLPYTPDCGVYHMLKWTARDTCGNETVCTYPLELYDCQKPLVDVITTPAVYNLSFSNFNLHVEDFILDIRDDCQDSSDVLYSLTPDSFVPFKQFHLCDFPAWGVALDIDFWVADGGRDNDCDGTIEWAERILEKHQFQIIVNDALGTVDCDTIDYTASGNIRTYTNNSVAKVEVSLTGPTQPTQTQITGQDGNYLFLYGPQGGDIIKITPRRNDNHRNGVSTLDLVKIQKHLLGTEPFTNPYLLIAGDVNSSNALSAIDLIEIRKLILGLYQEFPNSPSWQFVRADYNFSDTFPPTYDRSSISFIDTAGLVNGDFIAIKMGDVNGTVDPGFQGGAEDRASRSVEWNVTDIAFQTGDIISIPISIPNANELIGFQFTMQHDGLEFLGMTSADIHLSNQNFAVFDNAMTVSWNKDLHPSLKTIATIVIQAKAKQDGHLAAHLKINSAITEAEAYTSNEDVLRPLLKISAGPEFVDCKSEPVSLCIQDAGVRLPANNQLYLGDLDPNATSCSVHVSRTTKVKSACVGQLQYETFLFPADGSPAVLLKSMTPVTLDSTGEAELTFDTELAIDSIIKNQGLDYTDACGSFHTVQWAVRDECGGVSICEEKLDLYDCSSPEVIATPGLTTVPFPLAGQVTLSANTFITSVRDDCSGPNELLFSFSPSEYTPEHITTCDNIPAFGVELELSIWIADKGRDYNCDGKIEWNESRLDSVSTFIVYVDHIGACEGGDPPLLYGEINTHYWDPVEQVHINFFNPNHVFPDYITTGNGQYYIMTFWKGQELTITPERNDFHRNGVSTLDLVKIQKHLLGIESLDNPYDIIAADANNNEYVSVIDLVEIRKLILGLYTEFPNNRSWRFVPGKFVFADTMHPWPFPEKIEFTSSNSSTNTDFIAIKIGDVNNTVNANLKAVELRNAIQEVSIRTGNQDFRKNEIFEIPIFISDLNELSGFQFTLSSPLLEFLSVSSGLLEIAEDDYALFGDHMTMSWFDLDSKQVKPADVLFTIKAIAKKAGSLQQSLSINSTLTEAEMYSANEEIYDPKLRIMDPGTPGLQVFAAEPNPWTDKCSVPFFNPEAANITFEVFDLSGKTEYQVTKFFEQGNQQILLSADQLRNPGLKIFSLRNDKEHITGRMMFSK